MRYRGALSLSASLSRSARWYRLMAFYCSKKYRSIIELLYVIERRMRVDWIPCHIKSDVTPPAASHVTGTCNGCSGEMAHSHRLMEVRLYTSQWIQRMVGKNVSPSCFITPRTARAIVGQTTVRHWYGVKLPIIAGCCTGIEGIDLRISCADIPTMQLERVANAQQL